MLQNPCKTLGFKKNMVYKIPPGWEVSHIQPVAYKTSEKIVNLTETLTRICENYRVLMTVSDRLFRAFFH